MVSFQAGRRASGKSSTSNTRPTRMSIRRKSSKVTCSTRPAPGLRGGRGGRCGRGLGGRLGRGRRLWLGRRGRLGRRRRGLIAPARLGRRGVRRQGGRVAVDLGLGGLGGARRRRRRGRGGRRRGLGRGGGRRGGGLGRGIGHGDGQRGGGLLGRCLLDVLGLRVVLGAAAGLLVAGGDGRRGSRHWIGGARRLHLRRRGGHGRGGCGGHLLDDVAAGALLLGHVVDLHRTDRDDGRGGQAGRGLGGDGADAGGEQAARGAGRADVGEEELLG